MKSYALIGAISGLLIPALIAMADTRAEMQDTAETLRPVMERTEGMLANGRLDEISRMILSTFPEKTRTPVQSLVLGNVLFKQDPKASYALHKQAVAGLPDDADAQLEWAMEQHRAGEYAGASETYAKFAKAHPDFGPVLGLWAECLVRTGQTRRAAETWLQSEKGHGSLEQFESWVCDVHTRESSDRKRATLLPRATAGDVDAAERLIALDCNFERDWWNSGPQATYLAKDLEVLRKVKFLDEKRAGQILCAAECGLIEAKQNGDAAAVLRQYGLFFGDHATMPLSGKLVSPMLSAALSSGAISKDEARRKWGPPIVTLAKASRDAGAFNAAAHLYVDTDKLRETDQLGWDATGDARFAASLIVGLAGKGLALDDARLVKAQKQFPQNAEIARVVVMLTKKAGKPMQPALINAIQAEYSHFSAGGLLMARPKASALRAYFAELTKELNATPAAG